MGVKKRIVSLLAAVLLLGGPAVAVAAVPAMAAACTTSAADGNCGPYSDPGVYQGANGSDLVAQDVWNQIPGWSQTLTASSDSNWSVSANMPAGNGAVVSYPDTQVTYTLSSGKPDPVSDFGAALNSSWANINPSGSGLDYEYAYDIWLADTSQDSWANDQEIMIWTDNHGQTPAGDDTGKHYTDAAGTNWEVWIDPGSTSVSTNNDIVSFVRQSNAATGSADLLGFYNYLRSSGYTSAAAGIDQIGYGVELCSTGGVPKTFGLTSYTLTPGTPAPAPPLTGPVTLVYMPAKCVDDNANSSADGAKVQLWDCWGGANQKWTVNKDRTVTINGKCLDVTGQGTANGTKVEIWACNGGDNQKWTQAAPGGQLVSAQSGKCLDDPGFSTANGTPLDIWTCKAGYTNIEWNLP